MPGMDPPVGCPQDDVNKPTRKEYQGYAPATQDARKAPVCHLALESSRPALAGSGISTIHDGSIQSIDIGTRSCCRDVDILIVVVWLSGKLDLCEVELASGDEVDCPEPGVCSVFVVRFEGNASSAEMMMY